MLEARPAKAGSVFEKNTFQNYTAGKFKDLLVNEGTMMDDFLDQIEGAVATKSEQEKKQLQRQLESKKISPRAFRQKSKDLERWVSNERKEIGQKRLKVQDTCGEISQFMSKLEQEKKLMLDQLSA